MKSSSTHRIQFSTTNTLPIPNSSSDKEERKKSINAAQHSDSDNDSDNLRNLGFARARDRSNRAVLEQGRSARPLKQIPEKSVLSAEAIPAADPSKSDSMEKILSDLLGRLASHASKEEIALAKSLQEGLSKMQKEMSVLRERDEWYSDPDKYEITTRRHYDDLKEQVRNSTGGWVTADKKRRDLHIENEILKIRLGELEAAKSQGTVESGASEIDVKSMETQPARRTTKDNAVQTETAPEAEEGTQLRAENHRLQRKIKELEEEVFEQKVEIAKKDQEIIRLRFERTGPNATRELAQFMGKLGELEEICKTHGVNLDFIRDFKQMHNLRRRAQETYTGFSHKFEQYQAVLNSDFVEELINGPDPDNVHLMSKKLAGAVNTMQQMWKSLPSHTWDAVSKMLRLDEVAPSVKTGSNRI